MFRFFRRNPSASLVAELHATVMERSRQPAFFSSYGVDDTLEGRFELVVLHAAMIVRRLAAAQPPGPELARDLTDAVFSHFDIALRESGVGDLTVPKKIKKFAQSYLGRAKAYGDALDRNDEIALESAIARNIYGTEDVADAPFCRILARYTESVDRTLAAAQPSEVYASSIAWPDVAAIGKRFHGQ